MRIFVYEYTCAVAGEDLPASLRTEGWAMLSAVAEDFSRVPGVETVSLLHPAGVRLPVVSRVQTHAGDEEAVFRQLARGADYTLVIAPESDGVLAARCRWVLESGGRLLGPTPDAVLLTGDKLALAEHLTRARIATPATVLGTWSATDERWAFPAYPPFPAVCKPRHGAGSQATFLVRHAEELARCAVMARQEGAGGEMLLQPFVQGTPASVAFLVGPRQQLALLPSAQHLSADGRFRYRGGTLPLPPELARRALHLGQQAVVAVAGLQGYVGVDLILADDGGDQVIEINPRLTTSYIGLRRLARGNLAEEMLGVVRDEHRVELAWRAGTVQFAADGSIF